MELKFFFYSVVGWFQYLKRNAYFGIKYSICALQKLNPSQHPVFCHKWADQSLQEKKKPNSIRKTIYNYVLYFYGFVIIKIMKTTKKNESKRDLQTPLYYCQTLLLFVREVKRKEKKPNRKGRFVLRAITQKACSPTKLSFTMRSDGATCALSIIFSLCTETFMSYPLMSDCFRNEWFFLSEC